MSRYIDYDKALSFPLANGEYDRDNANEDFIMGCETYKEWLENQPIEDVANIIHCKDCKNCYMSVFGEYKCSMMSINVNPKKFYCAYAEKRESCNCKECIHKKDCVFAYLSDTMKCNSFEKIKELGEE